MPTLTITADGGGSFEAYVARPEGLADGQRAPAVIVIQEIFGVNEGVRGKCDWLAEQGFLAIAPDLFWRQESGVDLDPRDEKQLQHGFALMQGFNIDYGVDDLRATLTALATHHDCNGRIGAVGYCLGGRLAYLMATRTNVAASVGYYGVTIESYLNESNNIHAPLLLHIAEADKFVPPPAQAEIKRGLSLNPHVTIHSYSGMDHAFTRVGGENYDAEAAKLADGRTIEFFRKNLA